MCILYGVAFKTPSCEWRKLLKNRVVLYEQIYREIGIQLIHFSEVTNNIQLIFFN